MHSTNYRNTLITVSTDCPVATATQPTKLGTIADLQFRSLSEAPYSMTSDELLLAIENKRKGPTTSEALFSKPQACLRTSPLVKKHGYGLHHDAEGRVALIAMESAQYASLLADTATEQTPGMRSARQGRSEPHGFRKI
jgi:hypothetical protein